MRVFISHSSLDKEKYCNKIVEILERTLGHDSIVYDALTFEAGERSIDEINRTLNYTDLYVILFSKNALKSEWVKYELSHAHEKLEDRKLNRVYPIIIDATLKYSDPDIPEWLREYNLKYIARPSKAARLIIERAKDISWTRHPNLCQRNAIFVGRNDLIENFEVRVDDYQQTPLNTFVLSGLPDIGRYSLARQCLLKSTIVEQYYDFARISLNYCESIEDFILKINDLGFTHFVEIDDLSSMNMEEKTELAIDLSKEIADVSERILIYDEGCIVDHTGVVADWFQNIIRSAKIAMSIIFVIITKYKVRHYSARKSPSLFSLNVPELNKQERNGLLNRLARTNGLDLDRTQMEVIAAKLSGYPDQVKYAVELIKNEGYPYFSRNIHLLETYNEQKVSLLLEKYRDDEITIEILALVSKYDTISLDLLYSMLDSTPGYRDTFDNLLQESFFELEGVNKEYVRLNEVVKNYILRSGAKVNSTHIRIARELFKTMFSKDDGMWYNYSDYLILIREYIIQGKEVDPKHMIPSVYLKCMSDLYSNMKYEDVIALAGQAKEHGTNFDERILNEIQYLLCMALAKKKESRCLDEINQLNHKEKNFILAFYYRQMGQNNHALRVLNELLADDREYSKAKREKVLVLKNLQRYNEAIVLAKENYYRYSDNPYHIQAYFDCLINIYHEQPEDDLLNNLLMRLERIQSEKGQSMYNRCLALYVAYVKHEYNLALAIINKAIDDYPKDLKYALTVKFEIARWNKNILEMKKTIGQLGEDGSNSNTIIICKSRLLAIEGKIDEAIEFFSRNIKFFDADSKQAFCEKLKMK